MTDEKIFLQEGGITVTSTRFITPVKTHAMAGITAVSAQKKKIDASWAVSLIIAGLIFAISDWKGSSNLGMVLLVAGLVWLAILFFNRTYVVRIELESKNKDFILNVVAALNEAMVFRG